MARHPQDDVTKEFIKLVVEERVRNSQRDVDLPEIWGEGLPSADGHTWTMRALRGSLMI